MPPVLPFAARGQDARNPINHADGPKCVAFIHDIQAGIEKGTAENPGCETTLRGFSRNGVRRHRSELGVDGRIFMEVNGGRRSNPSGGPSECSAPRIVPVRRGVFRGRPIHLINLADGSEIACRISMACETPTHGHVSGFPRNGHFIHSSMTTRAANPFINMDGVVEIDVARHFVHRVPLYGLIFRVASPNRFEHRRVLPHLGVTGHACLRIRHACIRNVATEVWQKRQSIPSSPAWC